MSIADDPKFRGLLAAANYAHSERIACGGDFGTADKDAAAGDALIAYIDSLLCRDEAEATIIRLLDAAETQQTYGGDADSDGDLTSGLVDFAELKTEVLGALSGIKK